MQRYTCGSAKCTYIMSFVGFFWVAICVPADGMQDPLIDVTANLAQQCHESEHYKHDMASQYKKRSFDQQCLIAGSSSSANSCYHSTVGPLLGEARTCGGLEDVEATDCSSPEGIDYLVVKSMAQFYLLVRRIKEHNRIDLNTVSSDEGGCLSVQHKVSVPSHQNLRTPWELGGFWPVIEQAPRVFSTIPGQQFSSNHTQWYDAWTRFPLPRYY